MKICYLADATRIHTQRWAKYFADRSYEVHLISIRFAESCFLEKDRLHTLKGLVPQIHAFSHITNAISYRDQIRILLKQIKPDILHSHFVTNYGVLGAMSGFHPFVLTAWGSDVLIVPSRYPFFKPFIKYSIRKADLITCDGENTRDEIIRLGANPQKVNLILHGVDVKKFKPIRGNESVKGERKFDSPTIISVRGLVPIYDVETLIKCAPLVLKEVHDAKFIIAGEGQQKKHLEGHVKHMGIQKSVKFVGWLPHDELSDYLASADVYVSTSISEGGTSVSLTEAMACGLAPVVTDVGDNRKWIEDGINGFIVPAKSAGLLAKSIVFLLKNQDIRQRMGAINRKLIEKNASYENEMEKIEKLYHYLANTHAKLKF